MIFEDYLILQNKKNTYHEYFPQLNPNTWMKFNVSIAM